MCWIEHPQRDTNDQFGRLQLTHFEAMLPACQGVATRSDWKVGVTKKVTTGLYLVWRKNVPTKGQICKREVREQNVISVILFSLYVFTTRNFPLFSVVSGSRCVGSLPWSFCLCLPMITGLRWQINQLGFEALATHCPRITVSSASRPWAEADWNLHVSIMFVVDFCSFLRQELHS